MFHAMLYIFENLLANNGTCTTEVQNLQNNAMLRWLLGLVWYSKNAKTIS